MKKPDLESIANRLKIRQEAARFSDPNVKEFADQAVEALDEADTVYKSLMEDPDRPVTCGELAQVLATIRQLTGGGAGGAESDDLFDDGGPHDHHRDHAGRPDGRAL